MQVAPQIIDIAHSIELAVAPVFLLTGVATTLTVLTNRLGRIIDRARWLESARPAGSGPSGEAALEELRTLSRRARLVHRAITMATSCALLICLVIVALFAGTALGRDLSLLIIVLFTAALGAFVSGLVLFLLETRASTASLHFDTLLRE